ncbi:MAG: V-type ATPase subunit [Candidatus Poseidoniaceae archaeon]|jgi:vacuolar-type H+-ATPase subunit C/Vma6|nr:V-type ATPase subunit [Candidatus Poseidoniaceae archaeon]
MPILGSNTGYVAARAKARKAGLMDRTRLRQLIQQTPDQLTVAVADSGYRTEIDLYAGQYTGSDLVEVALTHNLENELTNIMKLCSGNVRKLVEIYTGRFRYHNAKVVLRAVVNEVDVKKVGFSILPEQSEVNTPWLKMIEEANTLREAVEQMRRLPFGTTLLALGEDEGIQAYEDTLDRHYFKHSLSKLQGSAPEVRILRNHLAGEIDHRNIINILEGHAFGLSSEEITQALISGGRLIKERSFSQAVGSREGLLDVLRLSSNFDTDGFQETISKSDENRTLDPVVTWLRNRENKQIQRMSYLHPISALPVIHYVSAKVQEIEDLRFIVRGRMAGLATDVLEAHVL